MKGNGHGKSVWLGSGGMITTLVQILSIKLWGDLHCHWVLVLFYTPESVGKDKQSSQYL